MTMKLIAVGAYNIWANGKNDVSLHLKLANTDDPRDVWK